MGEGVNTQIFTTEKKILHLSFWNRFRKNPKMVYISGFEKTPPGSAKCSGLRSTVYDLVSGIWVYVRVLDP